MSNVQSAACWARDTPLGWLLLVLHDGRCAWGRGKGEREDRTKDRRGSREAKGGIKERRRRWEGLKEWCARGFEGSGFRRFCGRG